MSKNYYECHITMIGNPEELKEKVDATGWKFSAIDGDPSLGDGVKCYATMHYNGKYPVETIIGHLKGVALTLIKQNVEVIRQKIELVVYDDRSSTVRPV